METATEVDSSRHSRCCRAVLEQDRVQPGIDVPVQGQGRRMASQAAKASCGPVVELLKKSGCT